jgi:enamine deaminase RidA (YjgF/YER057c/UK114 family)
MDEELVEVRTPTHPSNPEEAPRWSRTNVCDEVRKRCLLQCEPSSLGEPAPRARDDESRCGDRVVLTQDEVGRDVVCRPRIEERRCVRTEFVQQIAELFALDGIEEHLSHMGERSEADLEADLAGGVADGRPACAWTDCLVSKPSCTEGGGLTVTKDVFEAFDGQHEMFGYSQAIRVGDTIYVSGTVGIGDGLQIPESMAEQLDVAYSNVAETLGHFGADMSKVVEQRVYVTDIDEASEALEVRKAAFAGTDLPASTMVEVSKLVMPQLKCEVAVVARLDA